ERVRPWPRLRTAEEVGRPPAEDAAKQTAHVVDGRDRLALADGHFFDPLLEAILHVNDVAIDVGLGSDQGGRGDDEADRLQVAEPVPMRQQFRVLRHVRLLWDKFPTCPGERTSWKLVRS